MPVVRRFSATVSRRHEHTAGLYTIWLKPSIRPPLFRPGQFLHLSLDPYDPTAPWPESRVFSIANPPGADELCITFAVKGSYTTRMAEELLEGREVSVKMPFGEFLVETHPGAETVLIAGGTGITPFVAFLLDLSKKGSGERIHLFYGIRSRKHYTHREAIEACSHTLPQFCFTLFVEDPTGMAGERLIEGRLRIDDILAALDLPQSAHYYLAGPPAMIASFTAGIEQHLVPSKQIYTDEWE